MSGKQTRSPYGTIDESATLRIERQLPGPIERVWRYLTESELRRKWLAAGGMELKPGGAFELVWRNDELTDPPGHRPEGFGAEHRMSGHITHCEPPRRLTFTWDGSGDVTFELRPSGDGVLLTVTHRRLPNRDTRLKVGAGWHAHLDVLAARLNGMSPPPFWDEWQSLKADYERRLPKS